MQLERCVNSMHPVSIYALPIQKYTPHLQRNVQTETSHTFLLYQQLWANIYYMHPLCWTSMYSALLSC